jgi:hypothetical protein
LSLTVGLTGCGTYLPALTSHEILPLEVLIAKIDCEFQEAVWTQKYLNHRSFLQGWQGQYTVTLKNNEIGSAKALTNTFPFLPSKKVTINATAGGGETTTANRTALMKFNLAFDDVKQEPICARSTTSSLHPFISGRIGFAEWMDKAFEAGDVGGNAQLNKPQRISSLGHTFEFSIDLNANVGAGFIIAPAPTIGINPAATVDRLDDGVVDVVIAKPAIDPLPQLIIGLTEAEKKLIAALQKRIDDKKLKIADQTARMNALISNLPASVSTLDSQTIQSLSPTDEAQLQTFNLKPAEVGPLKAVAALRASNEADEQAIIDYNERIASVQPKVTGLTIRPNVLPPDRNPEIAATSQQLTLERLNNALRIVP